MVPIPILPAARTRILSVLFVFVTKSIASVVPIKFVPAVVPELPVKLQAFDVIAGLKSNAPEATPFTVEVKFAPLNDNAFELIIFTPVAATPFTLVVNVLVDEVLPTLLIAFDVAATPFTVEVSVFADNDKVLVVVPV